MMRFVYKTLVRLYPARYSALFGVEMLEVFDRSMADRKVPTARFMFAISEIAGLLVGAAREWIRRPVSSPEPIGHKARQRFFHSKMIAAIAGQDFIAARHYSLLDRKERDRQDRPE